MRKFKKFKPTIEYLKYEELESIVQSHRAGNSQDTERLLGAFWAYMQKYVNLICYGKADITDKDIRGFIGLFMPKEKSATLYQFRKNAHARQDMYRAVYQIENLFSHVEKDEIENELIIALLTLAERYKSHGNYFHTYVQRAFHFQVHRQLKVLLDPQLSANSLPYSDEAYIYEDGDFSGEVIEDQRYLINEPMNEINENWINGLTASDRFYVLTKTQRRILKRYYVDDKTDEEIANELGVCRVTINRRRQKALHVIEEQLHEMKVIKD